MTTTREESRETAAVSSADTDTDVDDPVDERPTVNAREVHESRVVFTEEGNSDGWIATDGTVSLRR